MVVAQPSSGEFNLLLSTDKILELEPSLRNSKLFRALSIDTSKFSFDSDGPDDNDDNNKLNDGGYKDKDTNKPMNQIEETGEENKTFDDDRNRQVRESEQVTDNSHFEKTKKKLSNEKDNNNIINKEDEKCDRSIKRPITNDNTGPLVRGSSLTVSDRIKLIQSPTDKKKIDVNSQEILLCQSQHFNKKQQHSTRRYINHRHSTTSLTMTADFKRHGSGATNIRNNYTAVTEFAMHCNHDTRESRFLSKSLTNLSHLKHLYEEEEYTPQQQRLSTPVRARKKIADLFSTSESLSVSANADFSSRSASTTPTDEKPRTPSIFRRFSQKSKELVSTNSSLSGQSTTCLNVPQVNVDNSTAEKSSVYLIPRNNTNNINNNNNNNNIKSGGIFRNLSFNNKSTNNASSSNNNSKTTSSDNNYIENSINLKPPSQQQGVGGRSFPVIRSPFSRAKFDKDSGVNSAEERRKIYGEMLKSIRENDCRRLKFLLSKRRTRPEANTFEKDTSLIHEACFVGCDKCVKQLTKAGWSVDLCDNANWQPLHAAAFGRSLDAMRCLLEKGADPNALTRDGLSALHFGVYNNDLYLVHALIQYGADPCIVSRSHEGTPFQLAINLKSELVLEYLLLLPSFLV